MNCLRRHMCWKSKRFCWEGAPAYRFLRKQVRWSGMPISLRIFQFVVIHTAKGFTLQCWTTALSNSMKLWAMLCRTTQDGQIMVVSSDKMWSTGETNGKPLQYSCLENPMNSMKRQKDMTLKDELHRSVGAQYDTEKSGEITLERMKRWSQSENNAQLWMPLVMEVKSNAIKMNIE